MLNKAILSDVFFDLDHTLWDFDKNSDLAFIKIFKEHTIDLEISEFLEVYKPINTAYWNKYRNDEVSKSKLRYGRLKDTFDSLNYDITDLEINKISEVYIESLADHNYLLPNSKSILDYLFSKYKLHIITNGFEEVQLQKIVSSNRSDVVNKKVIELNIVEDSSPDTKKMVINSDLIIGVCTRASSNTAATNESVTFPTASPTSRLGKS